MILMKFSELKIKQELKDGLAQAGFDEMFPIQEKTILPCIEGKDLIGKAESGSGKTIAFLVPLLEKINTSSRMLQAIVIAPTRELAMQIAKEAEKISVPLNAKVLTVYGGRSIEPQISALRSEGIQIVIGTPGRLIDHIHRRSIDLSKIRVLVLDEADRMLDMGFIEDIDYILKHTPPQRQTLLFSATLPQQIRYLTSRYMRAPVIVELNQQQPSVEKISHVICIAMNRDKLGCVHELIQKEKPELTIIFVSTKRAADILARKLDEFYPTAAIHGDLTQGRREHVLSEFRSRQLKILVATDVAARGLDIENVSHVINFDLPNDVETFIHRVGRTGRAGATGEAFHIVLPEEVSEISSMIRSSKAPLKEKRFFGKASAEKVAEIEEKMSKRASIIPKWGKRTGMPGRSRGFSRGGRGGFSRGGFTRQTRQSRNSRVRRRFG